MYVLCAVLAEEEKRDVKRSSSEMLIEHAAELSIWVGEQQGYLSPASHNHAVISREAQRDIDFRESYRGAGR